MAKEIAEMDVPEFGVHIHIETGQRTTKQNSALHVYFSLLADALNDAGLDMRKTLREEVEIPWSPENIKDHIWRPVQKSYTGTTSTTELNRAQVSEVYEIIARHMSEKHGIFVPFPQNRYPNE